ncbi:MAG: branched-chain amino acid ABC transporter permease [Pseudomonadota bacterium]
MRFKMRRSYNDDLLLFKWKSTFYFYCLLFAFLLVLPLISSSYMLYMLNLILINVIVAVGLQILSGYTGLLSLGHAAFFAIGAYCSGYLTTNHGLSFWIAIVASGAVTGFMGVLVAIPALRMKGIYLAIATMAYAFIIEQVILQWESVTNGVRGMFLSRPTLGPISFKSDQYYYYLVLAVAMLLIFLVRNLLSAPTGRALVAIRNSEIAAQSMGIPLARYKMVSFGLSAFYTGVAGCLFAHFMQFIGPENFTLMESIGFIVMILIGGLGTIQGAAVGAVSITLLPEVIRYGKDLFPFIKEESGIQMIAYSLILILFVIYEPHGLYGRWLKWKYYYEMFPYYKKETFKRERKFYKTERWK